MEVTKFQRIFAEDCTALGNSKASFHCTHWHNLCKSINLNESRMKQVEERYIKAEIAKFTPQEMREYETSKMAYRDIKNSVDTAKREGKQEGLAEGIEIGMEKGMKEGMEKGMAKGMEKGMNQKALEIAENMLAMGLSAEQVAKATQLPLEIIKKLSNL